MTFPRARLTVAASLFLAWLGYLLYLVIASRHTIVLSRAQFAVAELCVLAALADNDGKPAQEVEIKRVYWSSDPADQQLKGEKLHVANIADGAAQHYLGSGDYILPLQKKRNKESLVYVVAAVPSSPGFVPAFITVGLWAAGPDPQRVAQLASAHLGLDLADAEAMVKAVKNGGFVTLARNVPRERAMDFYHAVTDAKQKDGAEVSLTPNDIRIYPLTPETREQLDELMAARPLAPAAVKPSAVDR